MQSRAAKISLWIAGIVLTPICLYWLFADMVIKPVLEAQLTQAHGAEVNIGQFEHHLFPPQIDITDVSFTDPAHPESNQLVVGKLSGDVELLPLLSNQLIMDQLELLNVAFNQPRATPGKVLRQPEGQSFNDLLTEAKESLPSVDDLLARSPLKTTAAVEDARQAYDTYAVDLKQQYATLPDKARLEHYKSEINKLKATDFKNPAELLKAKETFDSLKQEIRADKQKITDFKDKASEARQALSSSLSALREAPKQDYALLKGVYAGDHAALSQLTEAVFGEKAAQYNRYLFSAFDLVIPLLHGTAEAAPEENEPAGPPLEVLVKKANISINWQDTLLTGDWKNITNMHSVFGNPTTFLLNAAANGAQTFTTQGEFFIDEAGLDASQTWQIAGLLLDSINLSNNERLDASIKSALLATTGALKITDNHLDGTGKIDLTELAMSASGNDHITRIIANLLDSLQQLDIIMNVGGTLSAPDFGFSSDLDSQLASAALTTLSESQQDKLTELNSKLQGLVGEQDDTMASELGNLAALLKASQEDEAALQELLQAKLKSVVEQQKDKLLDKLFNKRDGR
ncbi:TIGR03545 family protein [Alteromonas lipolytica]|uniref:TIGR03545 family protein n=1 Tax=Alteromonas lipolytica TaxID=1856405 RepID=A0A1E8FGC5_9ALTE|nr:TIGR03545 family protein [Alteromonas lipolytica]OFI34513.1 TIGR03545 family protein [Alteromonas lipolytica]GGF85146.1 hypothetical protein GCM10011338_41900 [Alteromonas lipolytica]